jgi:hypothetical protein
MSAIIVYEYLLQGLLAMTQSSDRIEAEVILRPTGDRSSEPRQAPEAKSIHQFEASPEVVNDVSSRLRALGFEVTASSPLTISIAGPRKLFEKVFQAELVEGFGPTSLNVPREMDEHVEGVYVQTPPIYFR